MINAPIPEGSKQLLYLLKSQITRSPGSLIIKLVGGALFHLMQIFFKASMSQYFPFQLQGQDCVSEKSHATKWAKQTKFTFSFRRNYLGDLLETNHVFLKMLEHFCKKQNIVVQKKKKSRPKKSKQKKSKLLRLLAKCGNFYLVRKRLLTFVVLSSFSLPRTET